MTVSKCFSIMTLSAILCWFTRAMGVDNLIKGIRSGISPIYCLFGGSFTHINPKDDFGVHFGLVIGLIVTVLFFALIAIIVYHLLIHILGE